MKINFYTEEVELPKFDTSKTSQWLSDIIHFFNFEVGEVAVIFTSDELLLAMNRNYLQHDFFTDIITFNYSSKKKISGDLFISLDRIEENAKTFDVNFIFELHRVIAHGVLHLLGFDDHNEKDIQEMRNQENNWLKQYFAKI